MQHLYYHGNILTMEDSQRQAEALLVEDGRIKAVGSEQTVRAQMEAQAKCIDLAGRTLLPAFIDAHSHLTAVAVSMGLVDLSEMQSHQEVVERLRAFKEERQLAPGEWITAFGYDQNNFQEKVAPTREVLDQASTEHPILLSHASGHMGVVNTKGLEVLGITAQTPDPDGGKIGRDGQGQLTGYLEENAFIQQGAKVPRPDLSDMLDMLDEAQDVYLRYGITTVQDGMVGQRELAQLTAMAQANRLKVDTVGYLNMRDAGECRSAAARYWQAYKNRLKIGGYKIFLDGSPQGKTAWLTEPYTSGPEGFCGYPIYKDEEVQAFVRQALAENAQLLTHCNGDAAAQQLIEAFAKERAELPAGHRDDRPVMIHAQTVRPDQLERMVPLGMIPSFFVAHVYYWGDVHLTNLGRERAQRISPVKSAEKLDMIYTFHQDSPVLPPDMLDTISCAVNRRTRAGELLGEEQRVSPWEALKAVTINAAYQYFEEDEKGSLKPGKLADLVILDGDPLTVPPEKIGQIKVLETIKEGKTVYQAE